MPGQSRLTAKYWMKRWRKMRNAIARKLLDTRTGRRILIESIGPRVVSMTVDAGARETMLIEHDFTAKAE